MTQPDIMVYAEWGWTCQECFATCKGYDNEQAAKDDGDQHECERYE
jgi:hypothetical protein